MNPANTARILNSLIQTLKDGQEGFRVAGDHAQEVELKRTFRELSLQRAKLAGELQMCVRELGAEYETAPSLVGALHRGWIQVRTTMGDHDDQAILEECERGEDSAVGAYREALLEDLPSNMRDVVVNQAAEIKSSHDRIKALRDRQGATPRLAA